MRDVPQVLDQIIRIRDANTSTPIAGPFEGQACSFSPDGMTGDVPQALVTKLSAYRTSTPGTDIAVTLRPHRTGLVLTR